ncbi:MAG: 50S ribosomal protein L29 [Acidimicrobiia bacterium]|nr:50S ribosomal protein L29 [Acidimicrobiia bacterium]
MASDLVELSYDELSRRVTDTKDELFKLRFQHATGQLGDVRALRRNRREVARLLTRMRELEIAAAEQETR